jgi:hypothetical protein
LCFGLFFCLPVVPFLQRKITAGLASYPRLSFSLTVAADGVRLIVLIFSIAMIASGSYAPGLYGRF